MNMSKTSGKTLVAGFVVVLTSIVIMIIAAYSTGAFSALASINILGALLAVFVAVVGFAWFKKNVK